MPIRNLRSGPRPQEPPVPRAGQRAPYGYARRFTDPYGKSWPNRRSYKSQTFRVSGGLSLTALAALAASIPANQPRATNTSLNALRKTEKVSALEDLMPSPATPHTHSADYQCLSRWEYTTPACQCQTSNNSCLPRPVMPANCLQPRTRPGCFPQEYLVELCVWGRQ